MKSRKEKIQAIVDFINGKPLIEKHTLLIAIEGEDWAEDTLTGRIFKIKDVKNYCKIIYVNEKELFEIIKNIG